MILHEYAELRPMGIVYDKRLFGHVESFLNYFKSNLKQIVGMDYEMIGRCRNGWMSVLPHKLLCCDIHFRHQQASLQCNPLLLDMPHIRCIPNNHMACQEVNSLLIDLLSSTKLYIWHVCSYLNSSNTFQAHNESVVTGPVQWEVTDGLFRSFSECGRFKILKLVHWSGQEVMV